MGKLIDKIVSGAFLITLWVVVLYIWLWGISALVIWASVLTGIAVNPNIANAVMFIYNTWP